MIDVFSAAYVTQDRRDHEAIVMIAPIMDVQPHDQRDHVPCRPTRRHFLT
jgi:hypothetical protein